MARSSVNSCRARLFDAHGDDRSLSCEDLAALRLQDHQLLWVDLEAPGKAELDTVCAALGIPRQAVAETAAAATTPCLRKFGDCFCVRVVAVSGNDGLALQGQVLTLLATQNTVVSVHDKPVPFVDSLRQREAAGSDIGGLSAESFVAALLDWHLTTYFDAVADFEMAVERLEVGILAELQRDLLPELRRLRKAASRLRRMLAPHRAVFSALSRPDFRPTETAAANAHFAALDTRYERAMDVVENARDLVVGSFELLSSQTALRTNAAMRLLSFIAVVVGTLAVVAGILGMNFDAPFFRTQAAGFWTAVAAMAAIAAGLIATARFRRWF
ncbi:magnesium transporter CorA family protein [Tahibacter harae]|uniref:CorA family divalent cation transporter n=1 Tax=Tahibacter harae TaxID=2963937 RepID=A0ABT1QMZ0_9GAMM|nr:CorA family divalent cation transporter [Tahibacter harae]MCQ4163900.1 CorA family divalent cation transporter [Tahibacter harae]